MDDEQKHEQRMAEIYQREVAYRQHGIVAMDMDSDVAHDDIDYLWTRLRMLERGATVMAHPESTEGEPARPLPAPTEDDHVSTE